MRNDSKIIVSAICVCSLAIGVMTYHNYRESTFKSEDAVSKVFRFQADEGGIEPPIELAKSDSKGVQELDSIGSLDPIEPTKVSKTTTDAKVSELWFKVREGEVASWDTLVDSVGQVLGNSQDVSIVEKFPLIMVDGESYGFYEDWYTFDNALVRMITMVGPDSIKTEDRSVIYLAINVDGVIRVDTFRGLKSLPSDAIINTENQALLMTGFAITDDLYGANAKRSVLGFKIEKDRTTLLPFGESIKSIKEFKYVIDNRVMRLDGNKIAPVVYADIPGDDQVSKYLYVENSSSANLEHRVSVNKGKIEFTKIDRNKEEED